MSVRIAVVLAHRKVLGGGATSLAVVVIAVLVALTVVELVYTARLRRDGRQSSVMVRNGPIFNTVFIVVLLVVLFVPGVRH